MLEEGIETAVALVALTTGALFVAGRRPIRFGARVGIAVAATALLALAFAAGRVGPAAALTTVTIFGVALLLPRRWYAVGAAAFAALLVTFGLYAAYLAAATVVLGGEPLGLGLGIVLLAFELGALGLMLASAFEMVDALCGPPPHVDRPPEPERWPIVCLQVPTYNEPPALVIGTLRSLVALDYPPPALRIQVIDNNTTDSGLWQPVAAEVERLRDAGRHVDFVHLPSWPGYKAGALNWGLGHLADDVEIVGVVDADYEAEPEWLRTAIPHFGSPDVAFVQAPQEYRAWESSAFYRACHAGFAYFFRVGMVSRARRNSIIFAGTMGLVRRAELEAIGGWDETIITEDAELSLRLHARGRRAVYLAEPLGRGIMPLTYEALRKQRYRWAFGGIQILRRHWRALVGRGSGLTVGQRVDYLLGGLWWFNDALTLGFSAFVATAALGVLAGRPFVVQQLTGLGIVLPIGLVVLNLVRYLWALGVAAQVRPPLALAALRVNLSLSWVIALACVRAFTRQRGVFLRTPKFSGDLAVRELRVVWIETAIAIGSVGLFVAVTVGTRAPATIPVAALLAWATLIYGSATSYALADPLRAPFGEALAAKARLELAPRVGRVARSRRAQAGGAASLVAVAALFAVLAVESGRPAVPNLPFADAGGPPVGDLVAHGPVLAVSPSPDASPTSDQGQTTTPAPTTPRSREPGAGPSSAPAAGSAARSTPAPPRPSSTPAPVPTPTSRPRPTPPPVPAPTPTSHPTPDPSPARTPPPHPTPAPSVP